MQHLNHRLTPPESIIYLSTPTNLVTLQFSCFSAHANNIEKWARTEATHAALT